MRDAVLAERPAVLEPDADAALNVDAGLVRERVAALERLVLAGVQVGTLVALETDACGGSG